MDDSDSDCDNSEVLRWKYVADELFERIDAGDLFSSSFAESLDQISYHECIAMYAKVLARSNDLQDVLRCQLNTAVCFYRLKEYNRAINFCSLAISTTEVQSETSLEGWKDDVRARYILLHSLLHLKPSDSTIIRRMAEHADRLRTHMIMQRSEIPDAQMEDYEYLFAKVESYLNCTTPKKYGSLEVVLQTAQQYQRSGDHQRAVLIILQHLDEEQHDVTRLSLLLMQAACIYGFLRDFGSVAECCKRALLLPGLDPLQTAVVNYVTSYCVTQDGSYWHDALQSAICELERLLFLATKLNESAEGWRMAVLMARERRHFVESAMELITGSPAAPSTEAVSGAVVRLLAEGYAQLVDVLGKAQRWQLCNDANDRCIDVCNALLGTATEELPCGPSPESRELLVRLRARCFRTKALMYRDGRLDCDSNSTPSEGFTWPTVLPAAGRRGKVRVDCLGEGNANISFHRLQYSCISEAVAILLQVAGQEYETVDLVEALSAFSVLAAYIMDTCGIQPFQLQAEGPATAALAASGVDRPEMAERAVEAWKKVALVAGKKVSELDARLAASVGEEAAQSRRRLLFDKYSYLQQAMLAHYHAGVCSFHGIGDKEASPAVLAARCLDAADGVRRDIDQLLTSEEMKDEFDLTKVSDGKASKASRQSLHGYYSACGDVAYHQAQAYFRSAEYREMLLAADAAASYYAHSERLLFADAAARTGSTRELLEGVAVAEIEVPLREMSALGRQRQREAQGAAAVALSALGEEKRAAQALRRVADLCLGPVEDAEREVAAVRGLIDRQRRAAEEEMKAHNSRTSSRSGDGGASSTGTSAGASTAGGAGKPPPPQQQQSAIQNLRVERVESEEQSERTTDPNLLLAYFILWSVGVAVAAAVVARHYV